MSRIIRGSSEQIRQVRVEPKKAEASAVPLPQFRRKVSDEFLTAQEAQEMVNSAVLTAKKEGVVEAEKKWKQSVQESIKKLESMMEEISKFREELFKEAEMEALDLIRRVAKRVLGAELSLDEELLKKVVSKALEGLVHERRIVMSLNAGDQSKFAGFEPEAFKGLEEKPEIEVQVDPQLPAGSLWIRTEQVEMEVQVEKMVDQILEEVVGRVRGAKETGDEGDKI